MLRAELKVVSTALLMVASKGILMAERLAVSKVVDLALHWAAHSVGHSEQNWADRWAEKKVAQKAPHWADPSVARLVAMKAEHWADMWGAHLVALTAGSMERCWVAMMGHGWAESKVARKADRLAVL